MMARAPRSISRYAGGWVCIAALGWCAGCGPASGPVGSDAPGGVPVQSYEVLHVYPHDTGAFTQGLQYHDGLLYESTGLQGQSTLRQVDLETGRVLRQVRLPARYFAEGLAVIGDRIYQLTWTSGTGFIYDRETLQRTGRFSYDGEGWGLAFDGTHLVLSDGTSRLRFLDPGDFTPVRTLQVQAGGRPVTGLNELAWIDGELWANVFESERIARIDPQTGSVVAWLDLSGLLPATHRPRRDEVLNGIAYDPATGRIFVTGKRWPHLFEIRPLP